MGRREVIEECANTAQEIKHNLGVQIAREEQAMIDFHWILETKARWQTAQAIEDAIRSLLKELP